MALIDEIGRGARLAWNFLTAAAESESSANAIIEEARGLGFAMRREDALKVINSVRGEVSARNYIQNLRSDFIPNIDKIPEATTRLLSNFSYKVRGEGISTLNGERAQNYVTVRSDNPLSKQEVIDTASSYFEADDTNYQFSELSSVVVESVVKQPGGLDFGEAA